VPGVYYEYIPVPCVHLPFYGDPSNHPTNKNGPVKLFANWNNWLVMCGNKKIPSALSTCCGGYSERPPYPNNGSDGPRADVLSEYRREKLTYAGNEARCQDWGRSSCDPQRIGPLGGHAGHCTYHQSCADIGANDRHLKGEYELSRCIIFVISFQSPYLVPPQIPDLPFNLRFNKVALDYC